MTQRTANPKPLILSLALAVTAVTVLLSTAPPLIHADHDLCGCDGQCPSGQRCWKCPSFGYNCGVSAELACGVWGGNVDSAGRCPNDMCGCDEQCLDKGKGFCWTCPSGGWNCGMTDVEACGRSEYPTIRRVGTCKTTPAKHDECGCDGQCGNKGGKCWACHWGGYNCGSTAVEACQDSSADIRSVGPCPAPPTHDECGCDGQCALKGGSCWTCLAGGYNCGASAVEACGDDNAAIKAVGACPTTPYTFTCKNGTEFAACCGSVEEYCPTFHGNGCGTTFNSIFCSVGFDTGANYTRNATKEATGTCNGSPWPMCCQGRGMHPRNPATTYYTNCRSPHRLGDPFTCKGGKYPACCFDLVGGALNGMAGTQCTGRSTNANGSFACSMQYSIPVCCDSVDYFPAANGPYTASGCKFATYD